jgi:hypothetical protein
MEVKAFDTLIAEARERYLNTISDALDDEVKRFILMQTASHCWRMRRCSSASCWR